MARRPILGALLSAGVAIGSAVHAQDAESGAGLLAPPDLEALGYVPSDAVEGPQYLGTVRIFSNDWYGDIIGDRFDRWRTGAVQVSLLRGEAWENALPSEIGALIEYRFRAEIIAPDNLAAPAPGDRLYAPFLSVGASTHFGWRGFDVSAGADVVITGQQTGLMPLHSGIHQLFGQDGVDLSDHDIDNGIYLHAIGEISRELDLSFGRLRPFLELQLGAETLARAGVDLTIGDLGLDGFQVRDPVTGHRIAGINAPEVNGQWSFLLGADIAWVESSVFLPRDEGPAPTRDRFRLRGGVDYGVGDSNFFYGISYLSEEFEGQPEGQVVGVIAVDIRF